MADVPARGGEAARPKDSLEFEPPSKACWTGRIQNLAGWGQYQTRRASDRWVGL